MTIPNQGLPRICDLVIVLGAPRPWKCSGHIEVFNMHKPGTTSWIFEVNVGNYGTKSIRIFAEIGYT